MSSSGHTVLVPALLGWPHARLPPDHAKLFEVALHAGTAAGALASRRRLGWVPPRSPSEAARAALTALPAVAGGLLLGERIERRLGDPQLVAAAQLFAGAALWCCDRLPADRSAADAGPADALALGVAQAAALAPGVSRAGAVLTAARLLRFGRRDAAELSWAAALPVLAGAAALKAARLVRHGMPAGLGAPLAGGGLAAGASTVTFAKLADRTAGARSLAPLAAYRMALGGGALAVLRSRRR